VADQPKPNGPVNGSLPGSLVRALLALVDALSSWKRILVFLLIMILAALGYAFYQVREQIAPAFAVLLTKSRWALRSDAELNTAVGQIREELGAIVVTVWGVDMEHNQRIVRAINVTPEYAEATKSLFPINKVLPLFIKSPIPNANRKVIAALSGDLECGPILLTLWHAVPGNEALSQKVVMSCMSGIPSSTEAFIGILSAGFDYPLSDVQADYVGTTLGAWADKLAVRSR
jgi:hypothetical protein